MPQSHPTTGPVRFYHPYDFLPVRPSEAPVGILRRCCSRGHIRPRTDSVRLDTAVHLRFCRMIRRTQRVPRAMPVWVLYGPRTGIFNVFHILCAGPARAPYLRVPCGTLRTRKGIVTTRIDKNPVRASYLAEQVRTGPLRSSHGLFTISNPVRGP